MEVIIKPFSEDDYIEGDFLIQASNKDVFFNRKRKLREVTGFIGDSYEEDEGGGIWRVLVSANFDHIDELKEVIFRMRKYKWLFLGDSHLMLNGEYLFSDGKWLI